MAWFTKKQTKEQDFEPGYLNRNVEIDGARSPDPAMSAALWSVLDEHRVSGGKIIAGTLSPDQAQIEPNSPTWIFIKAWAEKELNEEMLECTYTKNDSIKTADYRGGVRVLKKLLELTE